MPILLLALLGIAAPARAALAERPIVYVVVIDGLDGDRVDQGKAPFIASLLRGEGANATYFQESRSVMLAETNPNHTAMMTGAYAGTSGIPGNAFALYSPLEDDDSCRPTGPENLAALPTETSGESASCPLAETLFQALLRQGDPERLATAGVFGKPKLGRLFAGPGPDGATRAVDHLWAPCSPGAEDDSYCAPVATNPASGYGVDDAQVMDAVLETIERGVQSDGRIKRPDFTLVNLHQVDSAGHAFGTDSGAYDQAIAFADDEIRRLVETLRSRLEWSRTVMILLSDHSMDTAATKVGLTARFTSAGIPAESFLAIANGGADGIYLSDRTSPDRFALLKRMREAALATPGVVEALYREPNPQDGGAQATIGGAHPGWHLDGARVPDLLATAAPGTAFLEPSTSSTGRLPGAHGGSPTRDNFLAVIGGGDGVAQRQIAGTAAPDLDDTLQNPVQSETVDVAPTVAGLLGLGAPAQSEGRFLAEAIDLIRVPGFARPVSPTLFITSRRSGRRCSYTARWEPPIGVSDVQIAARGRWQRQRSGLARHDLRFSSREGRRLRFRVRTEAASGSHTRWTERTLSGRRCRGGNAR